MSEAHEIAARPNGQVVQAEQPGSLLQAIVALAKDPSVDVNKLQALLDMQRGMESRAAEAEFNRDFIAMQERLPRIKKDGSLLYPVNKNQPDGPQRLVSKYAKWETIDEAIRPILKDHGFALSFTTAPRTGDGGGLIVTAILRHRAGHSTETPIPIPLDTSGGKNNIQGYGSALSYGKRYAATAALNVIAEGEDDDGKLAGMKFITAEQVAELGALLKETGSDEARYLQILGVARLDNIEAGAWAAARNMLIAKRQARRS
jgi:ERF superfamily